MGFRRGFLSREDLGVALRELTRLPDILGRIITNHDPYVHLAELYHTKSNLLYLGRGINYPVALEGALKLKEISYIHAEGCTAGEMKHGPIALIDENMPVVFIAPQDATFSKILTNIQEVKARKGIVIAIADKPNKELTSLSDFVLEVPQTHQHVFPITSSIILQLLAYELAVLRGCDVDMPRNLAKSVTVE